jgi:predicted phosphohydrolase
MDRVNKYPQLIAHYQKQGYRVRTDIDLVDLHGWLPRELYVALATKAMKLFGQERGKLSKALAEAVKGWVEDG